MLQDNRDIQLRRLLTENARLTNEVRRVREYCDLLERENARILEEQDSASVRAAELERLLEKNSSLVEELKESKSMLEKTVAKQEKEIESLRECLQLSRTNEIDLQSVIAVMRNRQFNTNSDATRFMNGQIDVLDPTLNTVGLEELAEALQRKLTEAMREVDGCPLLPSFIRFYLVNKFELNMSEQSILKMFREMRADIPQQTLNIWMHKVIRRMRDCLEKVLRDSLRQSTYTQNDETRLSVRSWNKSLGRYEYRTEYVHAMLSPEKKIVYMTYRDGSRSHEIQKEIIQGSDIRTITCDRASIYRTIENCMEEYGLIRTSCWFHFRHYLTDAYLTDHRVGPAIGVLNGLFRIERLIAGGTAAERLAARQKYSRPLVDKLMALLRKISLNSSRYGASVMKAVNYILDDEVAFRRFLDDGHVEMHNIAAERMFRHIAMGRRNWMHVGSHDAAENVSFVYSLLESCKLNDIPFGDYIEDICTRIMHGDKNYASMLPCDYKPSKVDGETQAVA